MTDDRSRLADYLAFAKRHPELFGTPEGGAAVALDPDRIAGIEAVVADRLAARGLPRAWAQAGVGYQDPYITVLRDAITYRDGTVTIHHRAVNPGRGSPTGAAVLPVLGGRILLLRIFRHATRQWHLEIPRGAREPGAGIEETAAAETREELGGRLRSLTDLGLVHATTGFLGTSVAVFLGELEGYGQPQTEEGIAGVLEVELPAFEAMIASGEITDSFTIAAFTRARLRGLL